MIGPNLIVSEPCKPALLHSKGAGNSLPTDDGNSLSKERSTSPTLHQQQQATSLRDQWGVLEPLADVAKQRQEEIGRESGFGIQVQFCS